ncbi:MAG: transketolase C-terminal domain-containing protein [Acidimicrobiales bacterium]
MRTGDGSLALLGFGQMLKATRAAAEILAAEGIEATVYDPRVVAPLDPVMIEDLAGHGAVVTVEDGLKIGGAGAGVRAVLGDRDTDCRVRVLGIPTEFIPHGDPDEIHAAYGLDGPGIAAQARASSARSSPQR